MVHHLYNYYGAIRKFYFGVWVAATQIAHFPVAYVTALQ